MTNQPEHPPDDDDDPDHEGAAGDDEDHKHVVLDRFRHLSVPSQWCSPSSPCMLVKITIIIAIAHQWISDLLGADSVESPDHNQVRGEDVPGRF